MNSLSVAIGLLMMLLAMVAFLPLLGWLNWLVIPGAIVGLVIGLLSSKTNGRNVNLVVLVLSVVRLFLGGGLF